jgi:hypothetical protein
MRRRRRLIRKRLLVQIVEAETKVAQLPNVNAILTDEQWALISGALRFV